MANTWCSGGPGRAGRPMKGLLTWEGAQVGVEALRLEHDQEGSPAQENGRKEEVLHDGRAGHPPAAPVGRGKRGSHDGGRSRWGGSSSPGGSSDLLAHKSFFLSPFFPLGLPFFPDNGCSPPFRPKRSQKTQLKKNERSRRVEKELRDHLAAPANPPAEGHPASA